MKKTYSTPSIEMSVSTPLLMTAYSGKGVTTDGKDGVTIASEADDSDGDNRSRYRYTEDDEFVPYPDPDSECIWGNIW